MCRPALRASSFANGSFSKRQRMLLLPVPESLKKSKQRQKCLSVSNSDEDILKKTITLKNEQFWKNTNIQLNHRHQSKVLQISSSWYKPSQPSETRKVLRPPPPQTSTTSASDSHFAYICVAFKGMPYVKSTYIELPLELKCTETLTCIVRTGIFSRV